MAKAPSPETIAGLIEHLGGSVIPGDSLRFDIPTGLVRSVIPQLNKFCGVTKISERTEATLTGPQTIVTCVCTHDRPENDEHLSDLGRILTR